MKILVSHESPISMLTASRSYNDYDYSLCHLFEKHSNYFQFFHDSRHIYNREVLLDCSTFELGKSFDPDKYKEWIEKLQPSCYIIPDVLENAALTIEQCANWLTHQGMSGYASKCRKIGVVQGKTFQELVDCYKYMCNNVDQIAISFDYSFYQTFGLGRTKLERYANGRQTFISSLISKGIWDWNIPVHLLGNSVAKELSFYWQQNIANIRSTDTSNPVVAGLCGLRYDAELGLKEKPAAKLADLIDITPDEIQLNDIMYNVDQYKKILGR